ncbi:MAG: YraN family protein [Candidatus Yanofskybacteria bacterium]|nr:YraN family protein [Candidatus Yanofskybacteria bacterium]
MVQWLDYWFIIHNTRFMLNSKELGFFAENIAARYLEVGGYEVVDKNYRKPWGEIDIIARKDEVVIFVEVKSNSQEFEGDFNPEVRVDWKKMAKIKRTAMLYLEHELCGMDLEWQIDVISVVFDRVNKKAKIKHFKNV